VKDKKRDFVFYWREFQGLLILTIGITMLFFQQTKFIAGFLIGFGLVRIK